VKNFFGLFLALALLPSCDKKADDKKAEYTLAIQTVTDQRYSPASDSGSGVCQFFTNKYTFTFVYQNQWYYINRCSLLRAGDQVYILEAKDGSGGTWAP
jgi:hypothetical protein